MWGNSSSTRRQPGPGSELWVQRVPSALVGGEEEEEGGRKAVEDAGPL